MSRRRPLRQRRSYRQLHPCNPPLQTRRIRRRYLHRSSSCHHSRSRLLVRCLRSRKHLLRCRHHRTRRTHPTRYRHSHTRRRQCRHHHTPHTRRVRHSCRRHPLHPRRSYRQLHPYILRLQIRRIRRHRLHRSGSCRRSRSRHRHTRTTLSYQWSPLGRSYMPSHRGSLSTRVLHSYRRLRWHPGCSCKPLQWCSPRFQIRRTHRRRLCRSSRCRCSRSLRQRIRTSCHRCWLSCRSCTLQHPCSLQLSLHSCHRRIPPRDRS